MDAAETRVPAEGEIVSGKFRVEETLGHGGLGVVVAARHLQLQQRVAIKFLHPGALAAVDGVARFLREAQSAARIESEHCVRILDYGTLDSGVPYIVMEALRGRDLAAALEQEGPLELGRAVTCILQACSALNEAHKHGIVHRDLKPANLFLTVREGGAEHVKILDFGVAKVIVDGESEAGLALTGEATAIGTPYYMAPEQVRDSSKVDARTDIWALGVILFELLTGELPFNGPTYVAIAAAIVADEPRSLKELRPDVPAAVCAAVMRCLAKDRERRWPDVRALVEALQPFVAQDPSSPRLVVRASSGEAGGLLGEAKEPAVDESAKTMHASAPLRDGVARSAEAVSASAEAVSAIVEPSRATPSRRPYVLGAALAVAFSMLAVVAVTALGPRTHVAPAVTAAPSAAPPPAATTATVWVPEPASAAPPSPPPSTIPATAAVATAAVATAAAATARSRATANLAPTPPRTPTTAAPTAAPTAAAPTAAPTAAAGKPVTTKPVDDPSLLNRQ